MSWSEVFPILTDAMLDAYEAEASAAQQAELQGHFAVAEIRNARPEAKHIVSTSLFWKNIRTDMPNIRIKSRAQVLKPGKRGLLRFDPWEYYTEPLLRGAYWLSKHRQEAVFRVYLAADMRFLVPDLVSAGCEVFVMESNSLAHNPGAMWRMLAFEDASPEKLITVVDAERAGRPESDMAQTEEMARMGLAWWRVPVWGELNEVGNVSYRPMVGCHFGGNQMLPTRQLMQALVWAVQQERINPMVNLPGGCKPARVHGSVWPDYGFDEWFLQTAVYPRAAFDGILSLVPAEAKSRLLPLDIEYTQWANAKSELVYFGLAAGGCCGPAEPKKEQERPLTVREGTSVILRGSGKNEPRLAAFPPGVATAPKLSAKPAVALAYAVEKISTSWWVEAGPRFVPKSTGAELFLDRRYEEADVAVTGWEFMVITKQQAKFAVKSGASKTVWHEDAVVKIPKLENSLTLWRTAFGREFFPNWTKLEELKISPGLLLRLWMDLGKARVMQASAKQQGWEARR